MILLALLLQALPPPIGVVASPTTMPARPGTAVPADWTRLPRLPYLRRLPQLDTLSAFVRDEVVAARCGASVVAGGRNQLTIDFAVLVAPGGKLKQIVPRAIGCVTVEQYGAGLISRLARDNIDASGITGDTWFHTTLVFAWPA